MFLNRTIIWGFSENTKEFTKGAKKLKKKRQQFSSKAGVDHNCCLSEVADVVMPILFRWLLGLQLSLNSWTW